MLFRVLLLIVTLTAFSGLCSAQRGADNKPITLSDDKDDDDKPKSIKESLEKMRIEKEKKEHQEMLDRGEDAVKLSEEVKKSFDQSGRLTDADLAKVAKVEKIVKKIRSELGGDDEDDDSNNKDVTLAEKPAGNSLLGDAVDSLQTRANALYDELKKTTRFTISAAAIYSSNAVLRLAKSLRFIH